MEKAIRSIKRSSLMAAVAMFAGVTSSYAADVAVNNASFEEPPVVDGGFTDVQIAAQALTALPGWGSLAGGGAAGVQNWSAAHFSNAAAQNTPTGGAGPQGLYVNHYTAGATSAVFQNVGALQPLTTYLLTVSIGQRLDRVNDAGTISLLNVAVADNSSNAGTVLSSVTGVSPVAGTYVDFSTAFTTGPSVSGNLTINLSESNAGGIQAAFDNVRLTSVSSVPEPGTLSAGVAAIGLLLGRSRRRA